MPLLQWSVSQTLLEFFAQLKNTSNCYALDHRFTSSLMCRGIMRGKGGHNSPSAESLQGHQEVPTMSQVS